MPKISNRGQKMPASPIRKLVPFADAAKKRGVKVYHLNIGQPDIETPPQFMDALRTSDLKIVAYSNSAGNESLRKKMLSYYERYQIKGLGLDNILITTGGSEALRFTLMSCLDAGDEIIIPEPFYANYNGFCVECGATVVPITTRIEDNFDLPDIEEFEKLITPKTKALMICNPGNPSGKLYSREALERLCELVLKHDLYLIADEVYREFTYDGQDHYSTLLLKSIEQNTVVVDSVSKRYSACGARIGTMVSRNADLIQTALKFAQARLSPPTLAQIGTEAVLDLPQSYFEEVKAEYLSRRDTLISALKNIPGVVVPEASGAFYIIVGLPVDDAEKFCRWILESFDHNGATVMVAPASGFYGTKGLGYDQVRIAYVINKSDIQKAMVCLAEALKAYPGTLREVVASRRKA